MTDSNYTHLVLVVDRSGSMAEVQEEAQNGINVFLKEQYEQPGKITTTVVEFDTEIDTVARMSESPIEYALNPRGMTALLDAVGSEIHKTGYDLSGLDEPVRPGKVLFVIVTDGQENSSHEYNLSTVKSLVEHQRDAYNWTFHFIGADESAWQGENLGMSRSQYANDADGTRIMYNKLSEAVSAYRSAPINAAFVMDEVIENEPT